MPGLHHNLKPSRSMRLAAWIFPIGLDGRQRESWSQWTNWRILLLLLMGPALLIGAFTARGTEVTWWERGAFGVVGAAMSTILIRVLIGYRRLKASTRTTTSAPSAPHPAQPNAPHTAD
ncbi:hypothetical protein [Streptomyces noursei]|uniref:hypothetical protein n=1 Tax=Streptomyces noursei TaxID=1971 RepID=UPI0023B857EE|nr:hypothetical protein [Streptomyces noursei]